MDDAPRLNRLLELAEKGPALRHALLDELTELLAFWPGDCPDAMRASCEALLARAAREADDNDRADPAPTVRMSSQERIPPHDILGSTLIEMARAGLDAHMRMAEALNLSRSRLEEILATDHGLALVCKSLNLSRTVFSTLAMLSNRKSGTAQCYAVLDGYDAVAPEAVAELRAAHSGSVISFPRELRVARAS